MNLGTVLTVFIFAFLTAGVPTNLAIAAENQVKGTLTYRTVSVTLKSFGAMPEAFAARVDNAGRLAGKLAFDDFAAGGPKVDIEFDVTVFKEFKSN